MFWIIFFVVAGICIEAKWHPRLSIDNVGTTHVRKVLNFSYKNKYGIITKKEVCEL